MARRALRGSDWHIRREEAMRRTFVILGLAWAGCASDAPFDPPDPPHLRPVVTVPAGVVIAEPSAIVSERSLADLAGDPTGLAIESGRLLVLMSEGAIYEVDGSTAPVW